MPIVTKMAAEIICCNDHAAVVDGLPVTMHVQLLHQLQPVISQHVQFAGKGISYCKC